MPDLHQAFEGKTELFQKKNDKKGSQVEVPSFRALRAVCVQGGVGAGKAQVWLLWEGGSPSPVPLALIITSSHRRAEFVQRVREHPMTSRSSFKSSDKYAQKTGKIRGRGGWFHLARRLN